MSTLKLLREIRESGDKTPYASLLKQARKFEYGGEVKKDYPPTVTYGTPEYKKAYESDNIAAYDKDNDTYVASLPEVEIKAPSLQGQASVRKGHQEFLSGALESISIPQKMMMKGITGKQQLPSEAWGFDTENKSWYNPKSLSNFVVDAVLDPVNLLGVGIVDDALRLGGKGFIKNIFKPKYKKVNDIIPSITDNNFKSEIDWGKWNKEIPENKALMQEYNAIDYRKNPLSDKEKEMYKWFEEQMRFDKLPQTTNKQSIEVLDNFKQRIRTPEGQKRLKELGITEEHLLQDLKIVEDPNTYGYYTGAKNTIAMNPNHPLPKKVVRHEIEHGVQNALRQSKINKAIDGTVDDKMKALEINTTEIDDILSGLTLRREGTPNKVWSKPNINEPVNINDYKSLVNNKQKATDYFLTGSEGAEKSAFLGEVQQYMMDIGKIPKDSYTKITPEMVKETMVDAMFDESGGGKYLRLFNIIKADPKNYEIISKSLNKMLSISPLIGAGAYMQNKEYKNGGALGNNVMFDMSNPNIYKSLVPIAGASTILSQQDKIKKLKTK